MLSAIYRVIARLRAVFQPRRLDQDLDAKIDSHLALRTEEHMRRGRPLEEARLSRIELGGVTQLRELAAFAALRLIAGMDASRVPLLSTVRMDLASLVFSLAIAVASGLLFGLAPALQVPLALIHDRLKDMTPPGAQASGTFGYATRW